MTQEKKYTCIVCPKSCLGTLIINEDGTMRTEGFGCRNGEKYAQNEHLDPKRVLTTTVRIEDAPYPLLPVVSSEEISRTVFMDCLRELYDVCVSSPVKAGDVVLSDIKGTGVDILAARSMEKVEKEAI